VTAVVDFCAHAHRDIANMIAGCTVVLTLTRPENRSFQTTTAPADEQLHVLPHYAPTGVDEHGSSAGVLQRVGQGALQFLTK